MDSNTNSMSSRRLLDSCWKQNYLTEYLIYQVKLHKDLHSASLEVHYRFYSKYLDTNTHIYKRLIYIFLHEYIQSTWSVTTSVISLSCTYCLHAILEKCPFCYAISFPISVLPLPFWPVPSNLPLICLVKSLQFPFSKVFPMHPSASLLLSPIPPPRQTDPHATEALAIPPSDTSVTCHMI